jgi:hypothetical protein
LAVSLGSAHLLLNTATQELKQLFNNNRNDCIQTFLQGLTPTESTDYSVWKAIKEIKQVKKPSPPLRASQGTWAQIILILKPRKPPNELTSYRPVSFLPIVSKVFEKLP